MKIGFLMILFAFGISFTTFMTDAYGWCPENNDWLDAPCYAPYQITLESFEEKIKDDWANYYDYKGELWMEQKQYEMQQAMQTDSLDKWIELTESHGNVHYYYYLQGEAPDLNGEYVFTCNMYEDLSHYEEILKDDIVLKKFLEIFPSAISDIIGGIDESRPPQTSIIYQYEKNETNASLLLRVFEGDDKEPCLVPRVYTLTYHDRDSDAVEIRNSSFETGEILEFLESSQSRQSPLKQSQAGILLEEIQCRDSLILMSKHDRTPACVTYQTAPKIAERGWNWVMDLELWEKNYLLIPATDYVIKNEEGTYGSQYMIAGAAVNDISYDQNANSLTILFDNSPERGILQIVMPSGLLHLPTQVPFSYFVLADGEEIEYEKISLIVLRISFDRGTEELEIIGTNGP